MTKTWKTSPCLCVLLHQWHCKPDRHTADLDGKSNFSCSFVCDSRLICLAWLNSMMQVVQWPLEVSCPNSVSRELWRWVLGISPTGTCPHHVLSWCCAPLWRAWLSSCPVRWFYLSPPKAPKTHLCPHTSSVSAPWSSWWSSLVSPQCISCVSGEPKAGGGFPSVVLGAHCMFSVLRSLWRAAWSLGLLTAPSLSNVLSPPSLVLAVHSVIT